MATKSPKTLNVPRITIFDLWYAAHQERSVDLTYEHLYGEPPDDWLMKNMTSVVHGIVHGTGHLIGGGARAGQMVGFEGPYGLSVAFDNNKQMLRIALFLKDEDEYSRKQSASNQDAQPG